MATKKLVGLSQEAKEEAAKKKIRAMAEQAQKAKEERDVARNAAKAAKKAAETSEDIAPVVSLTKDDEDIAPVSTVSTGDNRTWFQQGALNDGVNLKNIGKAILGTAQDLKEDIYAGIAGLGENLVDTLLYAAPLVAQGQYYQNGGVYQPVQNQNMMEESFAAQREGNAEIIAKDLIDEEALVKTANSNSVLARINKANGIDAEAASVLGAKADALAQSAGQLLAQTAAGPAGYAVIGVSAFGGELENALQNGASYYEAGVSAAVSTAAEILTEKLAGAINPGGKALDESLKTMISRTIPNKLFRAVVNLGVDAAGEGFEEIISGYASAIGQKLTYMSEKDIKELFSSEEALDAFIGGVVLGGVSSAVQSVAGKATGTDTVSGLTDIEEKVVQKVYKDSLAQEEKNGKKLSQLEKNKLYDNVVEQMDKGYISTDTIEEILGGETYNAYKGEADKEAALQDKKKSLQEEYDTLNKMKRGDMTGEQIDRQDTVRKELMKLDTAIKQNQRNSQKDSLKKKLGKEVRSAVENSRLSESYLEGDRKYEGLQIDSTKYLQSKNPDAVKKTLENAMNAGANNTNRVRDFVESVAQISADKGITFDFKSGTQIKDNFISRQKELISTLEAVENPTAEQTAKLDALKDTLSKVESGEITVNGDITGNGIVLNLDSAKALNRVVGHEITHSLEDTKQYEELKTALYEYAKTKGVDVDGKLAELKSLYEGVEGADPEGELIADLVGDYLFNDGEFVKSLSVENRSLFQKLWDEIKYLVKVATSGSKEAKELAKVQKLFEEAYRESGQKNTAAEGGVKYALLKDADGNVFVDVTEDIFDAADGESVARTIQKVISEKFDNLIETNGQKFQINKTTNDEFRRSESARDLLESDPVAYNDKLKTIANADEILTAAKNWIGEKIKHTRKDDIVEFGRGNVVYRVGENGYVADVIVGIRKNGAAVLYDMVNIYGTKIAEDPVTMASKNNSQRRQDASAGTKVAQDNADVKVLDGGTVTKNSLSTWTPDTQARVQNDLVKAGYDKSQVDKWIKDTNSIAAVIAENRDRLDFKAADNQTMLKPNQEYVKTLDASTLCAKRLLYQGTFDAVQHRLPNTMLSSDDLIDLLNMMKESGYQTPCGVCYVESRRRHLGKFAQEWLDGYSGEYKPSLDEVTTSDGLEALRKSHPDTYEDFMTAMKKKGSANPKVVQLRTEYRNEIMSLTPAQIKKIESIGGLRVQSFSDFETPHLLDMMQAVMDMSAKGLTSQAYTKVPNFAWVFGDTGIKINLSLIAERDGFDADGNLAFSATEGMDIDEALKLRDAYSENVGTIVVGANDKHILACMADDRIDFIIPFHRSGWGQKELDMMGMSSYTDYTYGQNEHSLETGKSVANLYPPDYWDFSKSGKENAERYLNLCSTLGREPKFSQFLVKNEDGSYSLQPDGSTDGYWKTLIDFKMYNNEGAGASQQKVQPNFNMKEAYRVLNEYEGGANKLPVAEDVVEKFVSKFYLSAESDQVSPTSTSFDVTGRDFVNPKISDYGTEEIIAPAAEENTAGSEDIAPVKTEETVNKEGTVSRIRQRLFEQDVPEDIFDVGFTESFGEDIGPVREQTATKKTDKKKGDSLWKVFRDKIIDKGSVIETLALKTKNRELQARYSSIGRAESSAQHYMKNGGENAKSLDEIRKEVSPEKADAFSSYLYHLLNTDRMTLSERYGTENKPVFGSDVTAEMSEAEAARLERENPEFEQYAQDVYNYMTDLRDMMVESGVITEETAHLWSEMYPHYVPISREVIDSDVVQPNYGKTGVNAPIKRATGGNGELHPLFETIANRTSQTFKSIATNRLGQELKNTLGSTLDTAYAGAEETMESTQDDLIQKRKDGRYTFTVFEDGKRVTFEIDEDIYNALQPEDAKHFIALEVAGKVRRGLITEYNPIFALTNPIKDMQDVLLNSRHPARTYANFPRAIYELRTKGAYYQERMQHGGAQDTYFDKRTGEFTKEKSTLRKTVGFPLDMLSSINNFIEQIPRMAEYIASREMGRSIDVSMLDAARVTTDFSAGGTWTKNLNRNGFTFLNASVQGAAQNWRNLREAKYAGARGWAQLAAKTIAAGLPAILLNHLLWEDDEEYEELSDYVKENYYIVAKFDDGQFVRIPKGRTVAVIQKAFEQMENAITGDDEVDLLSFTQLVIDNLAPNNPLDNHIFAPLVQTVLTEKAWYGEDIVPTRLQGLPAEEQYDESTDSLSRWLGKATSSIGIPTSPYKWNYLIDQYSGVLGDVLLPMLTPEAESGAETVGEKLIAPLKDKFTTDSVLNNQNVSDFYETKTELATNASSAYATDEEILMSKYMNSINDELAELYSQKRHVQNRDDLSDSSKYYLARNIQSKIVALTKESLSTYEDVQINGDYAVIGDRYYKKNESGEWVKLSDDEAAKYTATQKAEGRHYATDGTNEWYYSDGEWRKLTEEQSYNQRKVMEKLGIVTAEEYWSNKDEYDYAYKNPEKYEFLTENGVSYSDFANGSDDLKSAWNWAYSNQESYTVSKAVTDNVVEYRQIASSLNDIKADKDANGKTRKQKVIEYLNELDVSYGARLILYKSEYSSDDTYNEDIVEYLYERNDLTYEERVTILKKLGFTVFSDGRISW